MPNTFIKIASVTVGSGGASSIDFTSIPSTYTDLCVKLSLRTATSGAANVELQINNDTNAANYSGRQIQGNGSTASSSALNNQTATSSGSTDTASTFATTDLYLPNYAGSTNKSFSTDTVTENNATLAYATLRGNLWSNTAAITSLKFINGGGANFAQYSTATLYGINKS